MELYFIRHGQGEHNLDVPDRLNIKHPKLTEWGRIQVVELSKILLIDHENLVIVSPTRRTIETSKILTGNTQSIRIYITPLIGPRMFPQNPDWTTLECDKTLMIEDIKEDNTYFMDKNDISLWIEGINTLQESKFNELGIKLIQWIKNQDRKRAYIISHDGTINCYRQLLGEAGLTRSDFLGEAGMYRIEL